MYECVCVYVCMCVCTRYMPIHSGMKKMNIFFLLATCQYIPITFPHTHTHTHTHTHMTTHTHTHVSFPSLTLIENELVFNKKMKIKNNDTKTIIIIINNLFS
jgi:hypothetical protein